MVCRDPLGRGCHRSRLTMTADHPFEAIDRRRFLAAFCPFGGIAVLSGGGDEIYVCHWPAAVQETRGGVLPGTQA